MKNVKPFYGRVTVAESTVEEEQRQSGIVIPIRHEGSDTFHRGVLLDVANDPPHPGGEELRPGMVIYYRIGTKIGDVIVVNLSEILAYEDA